MAIFKEKIGPDVDVGRANLSEIKRMGLLGVNRDDTDFRWIAPRNLSMKTTGPYAEYEPVYFQASMNERQRIVRNLSSGQIDSVLCVKIKPD